MDKNLLQALARALNLTGLEPEQEDFILTSQESDLAVSNAILDAKRHFEWKMANAGFSAMDILQKSSEIDWDERVDKDSILQKSQLKQTLRYLARATKAERKRRCS